MSPQPSTGVLRVSLCELFDQAAAGLIDVFGHDNLEHDEQVAAGLAAESREYPGLLVEA